MDENHKKTLLQCRSKVVSDLSPDNEFWDKVAEQEIFTPLMLEYIQATTPRPEKVRKLLDDLSRRGPHAYGKFLYCLENSGHNHLARTIREKERTIRQPGSTPPFIQESRFSTVHHPTESSSHLHPSSSSEPQIQDNPLHQIYASNSSPNIATSGSIVTSPSDESLSNNMAVTSPSDQLPGNNNIGQNDENGDVRMENVADGASVPQVSVPGTSTQDTDRKESINTERTKAYTMASTPRGFVLIINNIYFSNGKHRPGSQRDGEMMTALFTGLGFEVDVKEDQTAQKIEELLYQFSRLENLHNVDSLIVVLMSHGNSEVICGTDGDKRNIISLVKLFDKDHCPAMAGKPKMFIVNACRGDDFGCNVRLGRTQPSIDRTETDSGPSSLNSQLPANSDILLAYSTFPGNVSFRDENEGSWFIQRLVEVFRELVTDEHVMDMMTEVNNRVAEMTSESELGYSQTPAPMTTLRYKWYLNPPPS